MKRACLLFTGAFLAAGLLLGSAPAQDKKKPVPAPNFLVDISGDLLNAVVARSVDRTESFTDELDFAPVTGKRRTQGKVRVVLVPCETTGALDVIFSGNADLSSVTHRHSVLVFTETSAPFEVRQHVRLDARGIDSIPGPAWAHADICLRDIISRSGERDTPGVNLARRGFAQQREELEGIVSGKVGRGVAEELETELRPPLAAASKTIGAALRWAKDTGLVLESLAFSSTETFLQARLRFATHAAVSSAPDLPKGTDLGVRVHESVVNEGMRTGIGGKTMRLSEIDSVLGSLTGGFLDDGRKAKERKDSLEALEKLLAGLGGKPATITFAKDDPLTIRFSKDGFTAEAHIAAAELSGETSATRLKATYRIENSPAGVVAVRQKDIAFLPAGPRADGKKLPAPSAASRLFLQVLGNEVFKSRLVLTELKMPADSRLSAVQPHRVESIAGWMTFAWKVKR